MTVRTVIFRHGEKMGHKVTPGEVLRFINTVSFPATKDQLINTAECNHATDDVLGTLNMISEKEYLDGNEVSEEVERLE